MSKKIPPTVMQSCVTLIIRRKRFLIQCYVPVKALDDVANNFSILEYTDGPLAAGGDPDKLIDWFGDGELLPQ